MTERQDGDPHTCTYVDGYCIRCEKPEPAQK